MEIYIIALLVILFVGYKVYKETNSVQNSILNGKPSVSDYLGVFFKMVLSFSGDILKESTKGASRTSSASNKRRKKSGKITNRGGIKIKGGMLPKKGSIGRIEIHFDGSFPRNTKTSGTIKYYETDGNIQVIYKHQDDEKTVKFLGNSVDIYRSYK